MGYQTIADNLEQTKANIKQVLEDSGRTQMAGQVQLLAVSKKHSQQAVEDAMKAGQKHFGENRVQEAEKKFIPLRGKAEFTLHLIGPLQTNKVASAVALFDEIHTLDRLKLAKKLRQEMDIQERYPKLFIQVNTGEEPQKSGVLPCDTKTFVEECRALDLPIKGFMAIPPAGEDPCIHFAYLANLAKEVNLEALSMGMSADYEQAIRYGATHVRVGEGIFGERSHA